MTEDEFSILLDQYIDNLRIIWNNPKRRRSTLKLIRNLIDNYLKKD